MPERHHPSPEENNDDLPSANKKHNLLAAEKNKFGNKLLTKDEEITLCRLVQGGDMEAQEKIIAGNMGLIVKTVNEYTFDKQLYQDLVHEGILGVIRTAQLFEPAKKVRFATYAAHWINAFVGRYLTDKVSVIKPGEVDSKRQTLQILSINEPFRPQVNDSLTINDTLRSSDISPEAAAEKNEIAKAVRDAIDSLPPGRHRIIARGRLLDNKTLDEVGKEIGVGRERVRQIEVDVKNKLITILKSKGINKNIL